MKKEKMYIETSVPSAYFDFKKQDSERKRITRKFWKEILPKYDGFISTIAIEEMRKSTDTNMKKLLALIDVFRELRINKRVSNLAEKYIKHNIIPKTHLPDAIHIALASCYEIDYLLTWNIEHMARPFKRRQIREFNMKYKVFTPEIATPEEFLTRR